MDLYDKKIIKILSQNCRYSYNSIAKEINLSKDSVKNRIKKLEENKIIDVYSLITVPENLGYNINHLLLTLKSIEKNEKENLFTILKDHKNITFFSSHSGNFDLQIIFHAKDFNHKEKIIDEIIQLFEKYLINYKTLTLAESFEFSFLFNEIDYECKIKPKKDSTFQKDILEAKQQKEIIKIDNKDKNLLRILSKNPRASLTNISKELEMSIEGTKKRIRNLIKKKVIEKFTMQPNYEDLNYFDYMCLFKIKNFTPEINKELNKLAKRTNFILFSAKFEGDYNYIAYILAKNPHEFHKNFNEVKKVISEKIIKYDISILNQIHMFKMLSKDFYEN